MGYAPTHVVTALRTCGDTFEGALQWLVDNGTAVAAIVLPDVLPALSGSMSESAEVPWVRAPALLPPAEIPRLFNRIEPDDILQGALGDCWLLAAVATLAEFPKYIEDELFVTKTLDGEDEVGKYRLRLYDAAASTWEEVVIDDRVPCDPKREWFDAPMPLFAKNYGAEVYVMLIEKAFAKFAGSYSALLGGAASRAWVAMTGCVDVRQYEASGDVHRDGAYASVAEGVWNTLQLDVRPESAPRTFWGKKLIRKGDAPTVAPDAMFATLVEHDRQNHLMAASIKVGDGGMEHKRADGLLEGHAYSLICVREVPTADGGLLQMLELRNPWGNQDEWRGAWSDDSTLWKAHPEVATFLCHKPHADGLFWMCYSDFSRVFNLIEVCCRTMPTARSQFDGTASATVATMDLRASLADEAPVCHSPRTLIGMVSLSTPPAPPLDADGAAATAGAATLVATDATLELTVGEGATRFGELFYAHTPSDASRRVCTVVLGDLIAESTFDVMYELLLPQLDAPSDGPLIAVQAVLTYSPAAGAGEAAYRRHEGNAETLALEQRLTRPRHAHAHVAPRPTAVVAQQLRVDAGVLTQQHTKHAEAELGRAARHADRAERDEGLKLVHTAIEHACCAAAAASPVVQRQMVELGHVDASVLQLGPGEKGTAYVAALGAKASADGEGADELFRRMMVVRAYSKPASALLHGRPLPTASGHGSPRILAAKTARGTSSRSPEAELVSDSHMRGSSGAHGDMQPVMAGAASTALLARQRASAPGESADDSPPSKRVPSLSPKASEQSRSPARRKGPIASIRAKAHKSVKAMLTRLAGFN